MSKNSHGDDFAQIAVEISKSQTGKYGSTSQPGLFFISLHFAQTYRRGFKKTRFVIGDDFAQIAVEISKKPDRQVRKYEPAWSFFYFFALCTNLSPWF